jgi:SAM-dependent methyltransferase
MGVADARIELPEELVRDYSVVTDIHPDDMMWRFISRHRNCPTLESAVRRYFDSGAESAHKFDQIVRSHVGRKAAAGELTVLEFASGYGMVTRHMAELSIHARLVACDIHPQAVSFVRDRIHVEAIGSHPVPEDLHFPDGYDVVFALSFFSHIPDSTFRRWLAALFGAVNPGGILVFTTHGLLSMPLMGNIALNAGGFWFRPSSEQADLDPADYGSTVSSPAYVMNQLAPLEGAQLAEFRRGYWWTHQDVYVVARVA